MTLPIFAIRPEPGLSATIAAAAKMGLSIAPMPLSQVEPVDWELPELTNIDALLVGSANVFRHGGDQLAALKHLPVYAVGKTTAEEAQAAGFAVEVVGEGGLQSLLDTNGPTQERLLRLAGEERISLHPPRTVTISERVVYRVRHCEFTGEQAERLEKGALVLLHSASSAAHFAQQCERVGLDRARISLAALGPRILAAAGSGWARGHAANNPNDAELLALTQRVWQ